MRHRRTVADKGRALVLGGGGVTGVGWVTGLVHGLAEAGVHLTEADVLVGTSAGSVVAAQLASGVPLAELYEDQLRTPEGEIPGALTKGMVLRYLVAYALPGSGSRKLARLGRAALRARTVTEAERRAVFESRLTQRGWPDRALRVSAVDTEDGTFTVFDRDSGVPLLDAVAASCAVPLVWPPVTIDGHRYMDGGMRSPANADLADGYERVVVIAPITTAMSRATRPAAQVAALSGRSILLSPDAAAVKAIGGNVLDPTRRAPAARAGLAQAAAVVEAVRRVWES